MLPRPSSRSLAGLAAAVLLIGAAGASCGLDASGLAETSAGAGGGGAGGAGGLGASVTGAGGARAPASSSHASSTSTSGGGHSGAAGAVTAGAGGGGAANACPTADCGDPLCQAAGFTCVDVPAAWTLVVYSESPGFSCPPGWSVASPVLDSPSDPGNDCSCTCDQAPSDPCMTGGGLTVSLGSDNGCSDGNATGTVSLGCAPLDSGAIGNDGIDYTYGAVTITPAIFACGSKATPPPLAGATGLACAPAAVGGTGCTSGQACVAAAAPATLCVRRSADTGCPAGFGTQYTVYEPKDVMDGRTCDSCQCQSQAQTCSISAFTLASGASCQGDQNALLPADGGCHTLPGDVQPDDHFEATATADTQACLATNSPSEDGDVQVANPITVCCP